LFSLYRIHPHITSTTRELTELQPHDATRTKKGLSSSTEPAKTGYLRGRQQKWLFTAP
jgi:hypothetical protein